MQNNEYLHPNYPLKDVFPFEESSTEIKKYKIPKERPVRIYCDGIYDLFHYGHAWSLRQAKHLFPNVYLIVGVCDDLTTHKNKGKTVLTDGERYETVKHCKYVDEVVEKAPWVLTQDFIEKHKIDLIAHDDIPFMHEGRDVYAEFKEKGIFVPTKRTAGISTSGLITRIVKDYDEFVRRNLERGVSAKELNVSMFDENLFKVRKKVKEVKKKAKDEIDDAREEIMIALRFWERMGKDFVNKFEESFNNNENGFWRKLKNAFGKKKNMNNSSDEKIGSSPETVKNRVESSDELAKKIKLNTEEQNSKK
ncbi:choline-phosphate cytidylyltransferase [Gurleya vavrai]